MTDLTSLTQVKKGYLSSLCYRNLYYEQLLLFLLNKKETHRVSLLYVGIVLFSRAVASQVSSALQSLTSVFGMGTGGPSVTKTPTLQGFILAILCQHRPIFPDRRQSSIFGSTELNFRVRNGYEWTLCDISTDFNGAPSGIRTRDPLIKSQLLYHLS